MHFADTHAHLDYPPFADDFDAVLARALESGVTRILTVGTGLESSRQAIALAERYESITAVVGIHPNHALEETEATPDFAPILAELARHPRVVAIGETGLDYFRLPREDRELNIETQKQVFRTHLALATQLSLPLVVHQRETWEDTLAIMAEYPQARAVFHCFVGTPEQALHLVSLGHLVSFTGIATFKNAPVVKETIAALPSGSFMLETDCPYLAPAPYRGERCEPAHIPLIAQAIADLRNTSLEAIAHETTETVKNFFRV